MNSCFDLRGNYGKMRGVIPLYKCVNPRTGNAGFVPSDLIGGAKMSHPTTNPSSEQELPTDVLTFLALYREYLSEYMASHSVPRESIQYIEHQIKAHEAVIQSAQWQIDEFQKARIRHYRTMPYPAYLQTDHWQNLRLQMLQLSGYRCQLCNTGNAVLHVHHRSYENRGQEPLSDLIVLCADCHGKFHDKLAVQE